MLQSVPNSCGNHFLSILRHAATNCYRLSARAAVIFCFFCFLGEGEKIPKNKKAPQLSFDWSYHRAVISGCSGPSLSPIRVQGSFAVKCMKRLWELSGERWRREFKIGLDRSSVKQLSEKRIYVWRSEATSSGRCDYDGSKGGGRVCRWRSSGRMDESNMPRLSLRRPSVVILTYVTYLKGEFLG